MTKKRKRGAPLTLGRSAAPARSVRVPDEVWRLWQREAKERRITLADLIRRAVEHYRREA
jgi:hypothetical protein